MPERMEDEVQGMHAEDEYNSLRKYLEEQGLVQSQVDNLVMSIKASPDDYKIRQEELDAFYVAFEKTHGRPPNDLERTQIQVYLNEEVEEVKKHLGLNKDGELTKH